MPQLQNDEQVSDAEVSDVIVGMEPTADDVELVTWAHGAAKKSLEVTQESLRHMVTLTSALLAGSAALLSQGLKFDCSKGTGIFLLFSSLIISLYGSLPEMRKFNVHCPEEISSERERGLRRKTGCLKVASFLMAIAFGMFILA